MEKLESTIKKLKNNRYIENDYNYLLDLGYDIKIKNKNLEV